MLVKHYFPAQEAGLYASAAIMGKAVMYLPGAIVLALFPMVAANHAAGQSSPRMLVKAVCLALALSGSGAPLFTFLPRTYHASSFRRALFARFFHHGYIWYGHARHGPYRALDELSFSSGYMTIRWLHGNGNHPGNCRHPWHFLLRLIDCI